MILKRFFIALKYILCAMYEIFNSSGSDVKYVSDLLLLGMIELFRVTEADYL